ncbi:MAG: FAD-binding oxidoreductase, partial [Candidatus Eisenbacteria bacterium]|nr:FAD-binding oxidoreductase [Candidatus Eisenbacteria bacterium]
MRRREKLIHGAFDPAAAGPPIPGVPGHGGLHTMRPSLGIRRGPLPVTSLTDGVFRDVLNRRSRQSRHIREALRRDMRHLRRLVGGENIELSFSARAAVSTDSTGLRGLVSEAVFFPPNVPSLQALVSWCFHHRVPLIPYGAGSGYNMGVVPMAPAVTVSLACLGEIGPVHSNPGAKGRASHVISAGAGARYADVARTVSDQGLALRCLPNSPRAAVGGIAATGSNGGRRIGEVVLGGEAVLADGTLVRFVADDDERAFWTAGRFPMVHKFHGVPRDPAVLRRMIRDADVLPASLFVGSEGTTGILTRVDLELERPGRHALTAAVWLRHLDDVPSFVQRVQEFSSRPTYFELLTQPAIGRYLTEDFADLFDGHEQAYVMVSFEEDEEPLLTGLAGHLRAALPAGGRVRVCGPYPSHIPPPEAKRLSAPREELPRRLVSKCKTDMEVLLDALPRVIPLLASPRTREGDPVESILFGHLSTGASAILHWNIGGVDLTVEESAARGWRHLEQMLGEAAGAEPVSSPDAVFTGEHGAAGRPWLLREVLRRDELARLFRVKRAVDPRGVVNPAKLFLPTRTARTIRGRALAGAPVGPLAGVGAIVSRCTRCNACQNCLVMESQIAVRARRSPRSRGSLISGKRGLLYLLELLASSDVPDDERP